MGFPAHGPHRTLPAGLCDPGPRGTLCMAWQGGGDLFELDMVTPWPHSQLAWHLSSEPGCVLLGFPRSFGGNHSPQTGNQYL